MAGGPRSAKESEDEELLTALQAFHLHCPVLIEETLMQSSSGETGEALRRPLLASDLLISHRPVAIARGGNRICFLARVAEGSGPVRSSSPHRAKLAAREEPTVSYHSHVGENLYTTILSDPDALWLLMDEHVHWVVVNEYPRRSGRGRNSSPAVCGACSCLQMHRFMSSLNRQSSFFRSDRVRQRIHITS